MHSGRLFRQQSAVRYGINGTEANNQRPGRTDCPVGKYHPDVGEENTAACSASPRRYLHHAQVFEKGEERYPTLFELSNLWQSGAGEPFRKNGGKAEPETQPPHTQREQTTPVAVPSFFIPFRRYLA